MEAEAYFLQTRKEDTESFLCPRAHRLLLSFIYICKHHELELFFLKSQLFLSVYLQLDFWFL